MRVTAAMWGAVEPAVAAAVDAVTHGIAGLRGGRVDACQAHERGLGANSSGGWPRGGRSSAK